MKRKTVFLAISVLVLVVILNSCGGLLMSQEGKDLVGLWYGDSLDGYGSSYYDFREDGRLFETENSDEWPMYNYWLAPFFPTHYDYSASDGGSLVISQYLGIVSFEFETESSFSDDTIILTVKNSSDLDWLEPNDTISLTRIIDYTPEDAEARAFLEEYANEN